MKTYEVQGRMIPCYPEEEALMKLNNCPPNAEVIVWDGRDIAEVTTVEDKIEEITEELNAD